MDPIRFLLRSQRCRVACALAVAVVLALAPLVSTLTRIPSAVRAQDVVPTQPVEIPTDVPLPTDVPVVPTLVPTDAPIDVPTEIPAPPSEAPAPSPTPTLTSLPTDTPTPTPTDTPRPADTQTPTPTETPLPTDTPTSTPTDTPLPTATATPTEPMMPTQTQTPAPTATDVSTATATAVPTATATPTTTSKPTVTPTARPTRSAGTPAALAGGFAPASISNGSDITCTSNGSDQLAAGGSFAFSCTISLGLLATATYQVSTTTPGWTVQITNGSQGTTSTGTQNGTLSGTVTLSVTLFAPSTATPGTVGTATVIKSGGTATTTLTATVTTVTNSSGTLGYSLYCFGVNPASQSIPAGGTISFTCGMTGLASLDLSSLQLLALGLTVNTAASSGWTITANGSTVSSGTTIPISTLGSAGLLTNGTFPISVAVPCSATPGTSNITVTASLNVLTVGLITFVSTIPTTVTAPTLQVPAASASAINFGTSTWTGSSYGTLPQSITVGISAPGSGCVATQWKVQASVSDMTRTGGGGTIPASQISYLGGTSTAGNVTPSNSPGSLGSVRTVATGIDTATSGNLTLNVLLTPPNTAPTGTYTGSITVTSSTGP